MSYLMSMGRPDATVALYLPSMSMWLGNDKSDEQFVSAERLLSEHQVDFDIVDENALASGLTALPGALETRSGNRYRTVILPAPLVLPAAVETRLKAFTRGGGKVVFLGGAPQWIVGRTIRDAKAATVTEFSWANVVSAQLPPTPTPPAEPPAAPPAPQVVPAEVLAALQGAVIAPVVAMDAPDPALRVMKRRWKDADVYLFYNEGATASRHAVALMAKGRMAEVWDPQTGSVTPLDATPSGGRPVIQLDLEPYATRVIVVR
jgi:alpha-L-rhamnosidase